MGPEWTDHEYRATFTYGGSSSCQLPRSAVCTVVPVLPNLWTPHLPPSPLLMILSLGDSPGPTPAAIPLVSLQLELEVSSLDPTHPCSCRLFLPSSLVGLLSRAVCVSVGLLQQDRCPVINEACKDSMFSSARLTAGPPWPATPSFCGLQAPPPSFSLWCSWPLLSLLPISFAGNAVGTVSDSGFPDS